MVICYLSVPMVERDHIRSRDLAQGLECQQLMWEDLSSTLAPLWIPVSCICAAGGREASLSGCVPWASWIELLTTRHAGDAPVGGITPTLSFPSLPSHLLPPFCFPVDFLFLPTSKMRERLCCSLILMFRFVYMHSIMFTQRGLTRHDYTHVVKQCVTVISEGS